MYTPARRVSGGRALSDRLSNLKRRTVESRLATAFLARPSLPIRYLITAAGVALEVVVMALLGMLGSTNVLGLPGPLAVACAATAGIFAGPLAALLVSFAGFVAYMGFLTHFGRTVHPGVLAASAVLWLGMSLIIALAAAAVRRQVTARIATQSHTEELYRLLEESLLPRSRPSHPSLRIASYYRPGERGLRLGGDFFDLAVLSDGILALVIGDVCGHGPRAAALGAILRGAWRGMVTEASPAATAHALHHIALAEGVADDSFATALFAWIDAEHNVMRTISAGHPAPLLLATDVTELTLPGRLPLGILDEAPHWRVSTTQLPAAWTLFFYTDGLVDMKRYPGGSERLGLDGLNARLLSMNGQAPGDNDLAQLVGSIRQLSGQAPRDDVAIVAISTEPPTTPPPPTKLPRAG